MGAFAGPVDADFGESTSGCAQCVLLNRRCVPEIIAPRARVAEPSLVFTLGQAFEHLIPTNRFLFHWMFVGRICIGGFGNGLLHSKLMCYHNYGMSKSVAPCAIAPTQSRNPPYYYPVSSSIIPKWGRWPPALFGMILDDIG